MSDGMRLLLFFGIPIMQDVFLVLLFLRGIMLRKRRAAAKHERTVSLSPILLWVGAICGGLFCIPVTLFGAGKMPFGTFCLLDAFVLLCIALLLAYCNKTVTYDESGFVAGNLLGGKRSYDYAELSGISRKGGDTVLHCKHRKIRLDALSSGGHSFVAYADKAYFKRYQKHIPEHPRRKDPMNGNLDTPWLYLFIYLFIGAVSIFMICISVRIFLPADGRLPSDAFELCTTFSSYERTKEDRGTLVLHAAGYEKPFHLSWLSGYKVPLPDPDTLCSGADYTVTVHEGTKVYWIYRLADRDKRELIRAYDVNAAYRSTQLVPSVILLPFAVLGILTTVFGILVGRRPERYSAGFRKLFYKDSAWVRPGGRKKKRRPKRK